TRFPATRCTLAKMLRVLVLVYLVFEGTTVNTTPIGDSINGFALDLYNEICGSLAGSDNVFLSPFSISTALAMTYLGTAGNTATEMATVLKYPPNVHVLFKALLTTINAPNDNYTLNAANNLFPRTGFAILSQYVTDVMNFYFATIKELDFAGQPEPSRQYINEWVSNITMEKIPELLQVGDITPLTVLVLVNAIYFKGEWQNPFNPDLTAISAFNVTPTQQISVAMMYNVSMYRYFEDTTLDAKILELPYTGEEVSMIIILPNQQDGLADLEANLTLSKLNAAINNLYAPYTANVVNVWLPKFKIKFRSELGEHLQDLGMVDAFNAGADFSPLCGLCNVRISKVIHEAFVEVNEEGTEAAAATAVIILKGVPRPKIFRANHPFLFLIRHKKSGSILFMGRITSPNAEEEEEESCLTKKPCPRRKGKLHKKCCGCPYMFKDPVTKKITFPMIVLKKNRGKDVCREACLNKKCLKMFTKRG
ncbi:unnamed protein product, partial [Owenia fusiformis]